MANHGHEDCVTIRPLTPLRTRHKVNVVGGAEPTGKLPYGVGSGIFGYARCDSEGVFGERQWPIGNKSGIFFNPYARTNIGLEQPDMEWTLLRRPGVPLYPGSSARGIVLIGPSMGDNGDAQRRPFTKFILGVAAVGVGLYFAKKILSTIGEGEGA